MTDIKQSLFSSDEKFDSASLRQIILALMLEIEALRTAVIRLSQRTGSGDDEPVNESVLDEARHGVSGEHSAYGAAYLDAAWLTHCAIGPTSGWDKLVELFFAGTESSENWRELLMLRRFGYSPEQIAQYQREARDAETFT
ncbi:MAG: hypothetical protein ACKV2Q_29890 [Planctomycetaceae bacterium]